MSTLDLLSSLLVGGPATSAMIVGHHAGLWDIFAEHPCHAWTISEFVEASGFQERWIREWVNVLASAKLLYYTSEGIRCPDSVVDRLGMCYFSCLECNFVNKERELAAWFKIASGQGIRIPALPVTLLPKLAQSSISEFGNSKNSYKFPVITYKYKALF